MLVDDSAVIRGILARWISADSALSVVASVANGKIALDSVRVAKPDVIVLDIEMPEMDGLTALPALLKAAPHAKIIMASTLTRRNAEISVKALSLGAHDYLPKPSSVTSDGAGEAFRRELLTKLHALGGVRLAPVPAARLAAPIVLRPPSAVRPQIITIGCSTGGPQALTQLVTALAAGPLPPVLVTQHMPAHFTAIFAESLARASGLKCLEGQDGMMLTPGFVYVAPGDYHMTIRHRGGPIALNQEPPENYCRPSVDPMFRSVSAAYGPTMLAVVLTGMGSDGREGARGVVAAGGTVIVQDEASSIVWGMPGAVAAAGLAAAVLPLNAIAGAIRDAIALKKP
jgi:two-component system chemotaxis response regulator CheB